MTATKADNKPLKVMIGTPTASGVVKAEFTNTLAGTILDLKERGIGVRYMCIDGADVELARNYLATLFLEDSACTHLFFIDSDMSFSGDLCHHLLQIDRDVVGAVYPRREIDMQRLAQSIQLGSKDLDAALSFSMTYNVKLGTDKLNVRNGLCEVEGLGTGAMLIKKSVFKTMLDQGVATRKDNYDSGMFAGLTGGIGDFFQRIRGERNLISEDLSFCFKWREKCGGRVWAVVDHDVGHIGNMRFGVPYLHRLAQGLS